MQRLTSAPAIAGLSAFVIALTLARIGVLIATPLNLGPDEAQYWSWSLTPAFGYFSKPPMIAWLIGASTAICGDGEACIRVGAPLLHAATTILVFLAARTLYDARVGVWAALTYALMPGTSFSSLLITTDVPLLFFWTLALLALAELMKKPSVAWAIVFGAAIGAGLLSKYAMLYFVLGVAIALVPTADGRKLLLSRAGAVALAAALAVFAPNVVWNALHSFATVGHTASNANWGAEKLFNVGKLGEFLAAQIGILGPIAAFVVAWGLVRARDDRNLARADLLLLALSLPVIAIVAVQAFISRANANWAAPAFVALAILAAAWGVRRDWTKLLLANLALNAALAILLATLAISPAVVAAIGQENSVKRLRGWNEAGRTIASVAASRPFTAIVSDDREDMASLYYYARARSVPLRMWPREHAGNEYEAAYALRPEEASHVLLVTRKSDVSDLTRAFASSERITTIETRLDSKRTRVFFLYALKNPIETTLFPKFFDRPSTE
jgi:hypothetical protein